MIRYPSITCNPIASKTITPKTIPPRTISSGTPLKANIPHLRRISRGPKRCRHRRRQRHTSSSSKCLVRQVLERARWQHCSDNGSAEWSLIATCFDPVFSNPAFHSSRRHIMLTSFNGHWPKISLSRISLLSSIVLATTETFSTKDPHLLNNTATRTGMSSARFKMSPSWMNDCAPGFR